MIALNNSAPRLVCIDPGSTASGVVVYDGAIPSGPVVYAAKVANDILLIDLRLKTFGVHASLTGPHVMVVEMMRARGMPFSNDEMRTLVWLGRFIEAWGGEWREVFRKDVKMHLCGKVTAKDANIRAAILDRFGGKDRAVGRKATPGPLYGVKADCWSALAVGLTHAENNKEVQRAS